MYVWNYSIINVIKWNDILGDNMDKEYKEIMQFLMDHIPIILDLDKQDLKFDTRSMYYKIYKYLYELKEKR